MYIYICKSNLTRSAIVRLPHPRSEGDRGQEARKCF